MGSKILIHQFQNEYNPVHWHGGHISGVGYLKVPSTFGEISQPNSNKDNANYEEVIQDFSYLVRKIAGHVASRVPSMTSVLGGLWLYIWVFFGYELRNFDSLVFLEDIFVP